MGVRFLAQRLLIGLVTLLLLSALTFLATNVVPNDPARLALGRTATPEQLRAYEAQQGLDQPIVKRYFTWIGDFVQGDWGTSTRTGEPVKEEVMPRVARTLTIALIAMLIAIPLAFLMGAWLGRRTGSSVDVGAALGLLLLNSLPEFVTGLVLLTIFAVELGWLPVESSGAVFATGSAKLEAYVLPIMTVVAVYAPYMIRMVRVNVREVLGQGFVRTAVLRGVPRRRLVWRHVVPNASLPVVNVITLSMAELLGSLIVIEIVFGFPGVGQLLVESVSGKDIPNVQAITLLSGIGFVLLNIVADLLIVVLNPRMRARTA
jgi:peptide/nickel transport system permease protein